MKHTLLTLILAAALVLSGCAAAPAAEQADFERYGITCDLRLNEQVEYGTCAQSDPSVPLTGILEVRSYTREPVSQEIIDFGADSGIDLAGYEVVRAAMTASFSEEAAAELGINLVISENDYYNVRLFDDTVAELTDAYGNAFLRSEIEYKGERAFVYRWEIGEGWKTDALPYVYDYSMAYLVPSGYDGIVVGLKSASGAEEANAGKYLFDVYTPGNYYLFRLN